MHKLIVLFVGSILISSCQNNSGGGAPSAAMAAPQTISLKPNYEKAVNQLEVQFDYILETAKIGAVKESDLKIILQTLAELRSLKYLPAKHFTVKKLYGDLGNYEFRTIPKGAFPVRIETLKVWSFIYKWDNQNQLFVTNKPSSGNCIVSLAGTTNTYTLRFNSVERPSAYIDTYNNPNWPPAITPQCELDSATLTILPYNGISVSAKFADEASYAGYTTGTAVSILASRLPEEQESKFLQFYKAVTDAETVVNNSIANHVTGNYLELKKVFSQVRDTCLEIP